jgi:hypothetical protein
MILETFIRCFVNADALDRTVEFYKALLGGEESLRFDYPEMGLRLASVSSPHLSVLVIAGEADKRYDQGHEPRRLCGLAASAGRRAAGSDPEDACRPQDALSARRRAHCRICPA